MVSIESKLFISLSPNCVDKLDSTDPTAGTINTIAKNIVVIVILKLLLPKIHFFKIFISLIYLTSTT